MTSESLLYYCYCVLEPGTPAHELLESGAVPGVGTGSPLFAIEVAGLVAAVSTVPAEGFDDDALDRIMSDLELVGALAVQHSAAIHDLFLAGPGIVPLSMGAVYRGRGGVEELLRRSAPLFEQLLNRFRDKEEWALKAFGDPADIQRAAAADSARLHDLDLQVERSSPGRGFFLRKQQARARGEEAAGFVTRTMAEAFDALARISAEAQVDKVGEAASAEDLRLLSKAAFLVDRSRLGSFIAVAEDLHERLASLGIDLQFSGPWAPYSFAKGGEHASVVAR